MGELQGQGTYTARDCGVSATVELDVARAPDLIRSAHGVTLLPLISYWIGADAGADVQDTRDA
jgi:hypothetical protein